MIDALVLMCALASSECQSHDAHVIAQVIDTATDDERLRAVLVVYAHRESWYHLDPTPHSWDALARISCGAWQIPCSYARTHTLAEQARWWLWNVQRRGLARLDSSATRAYGRARLAEATLQTCLMTRETSEAAIGE
jgi:hypothetical protein